MGEPDGQRHNYAFNFTFEPRPVPDSNFKLDAQPGTPLIEAMLLGGYRATKINWQDNLTFR